MRVFYERVFADDLIGHVFTDVACLDLETHLPIIGDFWERLLFGTPAYSVHGRNPLLVHGYLHFRHPLTAEHFKRWLQIFSRTVDDEFNGERAEFLKMRATAIGRRLQVYINPSSPPVMTPRIGEEARPLQ